MGPNRSRGAKRHWNVGARCPACQERAAHALAVAGHRALHLAGHFDPVVGAGNGGAERHDQDGLHMAAAAADNPRVFDTSVVSPPYWRMKPRLRAQGGVANPRDSTGYRCGLRLALSANPSVSLHASMGVARHQLVGAP